MKASQLFDPNPTDSASNPPSPTPASSSGPAAFSRRQFLAGTASAAAFAGLSAMESPLASAAEAGGTMVARPKIGCLSWNFHSLAAGADPEPAIGIIGEMGFEGIELIVCARNDLKGFWTDTKIDQLKQQLERHRLAVSQFVLFQPVVEGLSSLKAEERDRSLEAFESGCRIGQKFEAPMINIVAPWARELKGPTGYLPRYYDLSKPAAGQKYSLRLDAGFNWDEIWRQWVETVRAMLERAKAHGLKLSIEHHTHCLIEDANAFLRLWDALRDPALGYNLDTGWTLLQREFPPVAIHKIGSRLVNLHMRDIDGLMRSFVPAGEGVMDFPAIAQALKAIGFKGFLSLEQDRHPQMDMKATCARYLKLMKECLG